MMAPESNAADIGESEVRESEVRDFGLLILTPNIVFQTCHE